MPLENLQIVSGQGAREGQTVMSLLGPLSLHTLFAFQNAIKAETSPVLIVDFTGVPFIDSAGLGALVAAHITAGKSNRKLGFAAMNTQVTTLVEMTHLKKFFRIYPTVQDAEVALDSGVSKLL